MTRQTCFSTPFTLDIKLVCGDIASWDGGADRILLNERQRDKVDILLIGLSQNEAGPDQLPWVIP